MVMYNHSTLVHAASTRTYKSERPPTHPRSRVAIGKKPMHRSVRTPGTRVDVRRRTAGRRWIWRRRAVERAQAASAPVSVFRVLTKYLFIKRTPRRRHLAFCDRHCLPRRFVERHCRLVCGTDGSEYGSEDAAPVERLGRVIA